MSVVGPLQSEFVQHQDALKQAPITPHHLEPEAQQWPPEQLQPDAQSDGTAQLLAQELLVPSHKYGAHDGLPAAPASARLQMPSFPATSHASHAAPQAALQQYPSAQMPLTHWLAVAQATSLSRFTTQVVPWQKSPAMQSESSLHVPGQVAAAPLQTNGAQLGAPGAPGVSSVQVP